MLYIHVIGHTGCPKCEMLNRRVDTLLTRWEYYGFRFRKVYHDTEDSKNMEAREEALSFFCKTQCINPNRIPALIITDDNGEFLPRDGEPKNTNQLYQYIGIQTDYADGKGVITPELIKATLDEAIACLEKRTH